MENESVLQDLKEIAITKIKAAHNRSVDLEATHSFLWEKFDKIKIIKLLVLLILSLVAASSFIITVTFNNLSQFIIFLFFTDIVALILVGFIIWEIILSVSGRTGNHGHIVTEALQLRDQSMNFLQYRLENLDKQGYIDEIKNLEIIDTNLKKKSKKYTKKLSKNAIKSINNKINKLEKQGIKKYFIPKEEIDSATEKLQKFTALRTCEAWIKFT